LTEIYHPCSWANARRLGSSDDKRLLIVDGYSSHVNLRFSEFCDAHNIICFCLPAHSTHLLQPLDVGLFGPLQKYYGKVVEYYHNTTNIGIGYRNFLPLYKEARSKAYTKQIIKSAFRKTGIVPVLPYMVLPKGTSDILQLHTLEPHFTLTKPPIPSASCGSKLLKP